MERRRTLADRRRRNLRPGVGGRRASDAAPENINLKSRAGPILVDAGAVDRGHHVVQVSPDQFVEMVGRLDLSVVVHYMKRQGRHVYFIVDSGVVFETNTPERLTLVESQTGEMGESESRVLRRPATEYRPPGPTAKKDPPPPQSPDNARSQGKRAALMEFPVNEGLFVTEWWNREDDAALSVARVRLVPGAGTGEYELHGVTERYLFLKGRGTVTVNGKVYEVGPGDGMLIKAGAKRRITNTGSGDLGLLAICRPRFSRLNPQSVPYRFVERS